jgi:hypothetical protein
VRSSRPIPGNPWPHDMQITVQDDSQALLELLWLREAWRLDPVGDDLPPRLVDTPSAVDGSARPTAPIGMWRERWPELWRECLHHSAKRPDADALQRLHASEPGSNERARLLRELVGPSWREDVGSDALTEQTARWMRRLSEQRVRRSRLPAREQPEHAALDALIPAWRSGLATIVQIPCQGTYTRVIGSHALLVTSETRSDPVRYREALTVFP